MKRRTGQRQDSVSDQMATVMRLAVEHGCYDAHDWLVARWGTRNGTCMAKLDIPNQEHPAFCDLTVHHDGAHSSDQGQWYGVVRWTEAAPEDAERVPTGAPS